MASYIHFTDEQKYRANSVDLVDFLQRQGEALTRSGYEWRWKRHDSVTVRCNKWFRHSEQSGGYPIDFVQAFFNLSFPEAVTILLGEECGVVYEQSKTPALEKKPFVLPEANDTMRRVYAYLMKQRFISNSVVSHFAHAKTLYEDKKYHNAVFVGCDENGIPRNAHKKGTYSDGGSFRGNVDGSDPRYSFRYIGNGDTLNVYEAPIDMLSYLTLNPKNWQAQSHVSLDGVSEHAMLNVLEQNPHIKKVRLCLDYDSAGIEARYRLTEILSEKGYSDISWLYPTNKDWNEDLKSLNSIASIPAQENPKIEMFHQMCGSLSDFYADDFVALIVEDVHDLILRIRNGTCSGDNMTMVETLYTVATYALASAKKQCHKIEKPTSTEQLIDRMVQEYAPHKDSGGLRSRLDEIDRSIRSIQQQANAIGIKTTTEKENLISDTLSLAQQCVKALSFLELEAQKQGQTFIKQADTVECQSAMTMG